MIRPKLRTDGQPALVTAAALAAVLALAIATGATAARADRGALQRACFLASEIAARPAERQVTKIPRQADAGPPRIALTPAPPLAPLLRGAIRRIELPPGKKWIALTFDFCEQPGEIAGYDGAIIDYLRANRVKATLFMGGRWLTTHPERTGQLMTDPLFELAGHGWAHRNVRLLSGAALDREIIGPSLAYEAARANLAKKACVASNQAALGDVAPRLALFRFPFGACNSAAIDAVNAAGMAAIQWDVSTGDPWPGQSAKAIADVMVRNARPGSIILAHANGRGHNTAAALPLALPRLKALGFEFVTVGELLAAGKPVTADTCYDSRPGDTDKYDFFGGSKAKQQGVSGGWNTSTVPR